MLGKLPEPWWAEWEETRRLYFDDIGEPRTDWEDGIALARRYLLKEHIDEIGRSEKYGLEVVEDASSHWPQPPQVVGRAEAMDLQDLLKSVLRYEPRERVLPTELSSHKWFTAEY